MDTSLRGFFAVMRIYECSQVVFSNLGRRHLKNIRLTCRGMDGLVASEASNLFSRVYVSLYIRDLVVLEAISLRPHLAQCVKELIWDTSPTDDTYNYSTRKYHMGKNTAGLFVRDYSKVSIDGIDLYILLRSLPQFPRLQHCVIDRIMLNWIDKCGRRKSSGGTPIVHCIHSLYMSPAMRMCQKMNKEPERSKHEYWDRPCQWELQDSEQVELEEWVNAVLEGSDGKPGDVLYSFRYQSQRACILLTVALRKLKISLKSCQLGTLVLPSEVHLTKQGQLNPSFQQRLFYIMQPLTQLSIQLIHHNDLYTSDFGSILQRAKNLEGLYVGLARPNEPRPARPLGWLLPERTSLKYLQLQNFAFTDTEFETVLLPWCFAKNLRILRLDGCKVIPPKETDPNLVYTRYVGKDVSDVSQNVVNTQPSQPNRDGMDIDQPHSEPELDSDDDPDDPSYYPYTDKMLVEQSDLQCETEKEYAAVMGKVYWKEYHVDSEDEYIEPEDTVPLEREIPMRRLTGREAKMIRPTWGENMELVFSAQSWGYEGVICVCSLMMLFVLL